MKTVIPSAENDLDFKEVYWWYHYNGGLQEDELIFVSNGKKYVLRVLWQTYQYEVLDMETQKELDIELNDLVKLIDQATAAYPPRWDGRTLEQGPLYELEQPDLLEVDGIRPKQVTNFYYKPYETLFKQYSDLFIQYSVYSISINTITGLISVYYLPQNKNEKMKLLNDEEAIIVLSQLINDKEAIKKITQEGLSAINSFVSCKGNSNTYNK